MAADSLLREDIKKAARPALTKEDQVLLGRYPRHTLEQARAIDATAPSVPSRHADQDLGFVSGFERIVAQEQGNFRLGGTHT
jgi:hypothetical protein